MLRIVPMLDANSDRGVLILSETWNGAEVSLEDFELLCNETSRSLQYLPQNSAIKLGQTRVWLINKTCHRNLHQILLFLCCKYLKRLLYSRLPFSKPTKYRAVFLCETVVAAEIYSAFLVRSNLTLCDSRSASRHYLEPSFQIPHHTSEIN